MANPAENGDDSHDFLGRASNPSTSDRASEPTREYAPNLEAEAANELILSGLALLSSEVPIPARLGKYTIQGQVGRGGMGIVWKGFDPDLQRTVAIKVLSPHLALSQVARRRFQREARAAAAINHENVLTIHSVEEQGETPFLVMEFVSGQSLKEYVAGRGKLDVIEVIRLSAQIAQGLAAAHAQGVIHRDVKPANVMLHEGATRVRLMDFGLARVAFDNADLTSHDHAVGTPAYMAPEQIRGNSIDARADLFSLGCVMYCMVAGHSPFHGRTHAETIHKIIDHNPPQLHDLDPTIPVVLSEIVEKLLKKNPDERYQSAFEVAETLCRILAQLNQTRTAELGNVLNGLPRTAGGSNQPTEPVKPSGLSRRKVALLLVAVALAVTTGLTSWNLWLKDPKSDSLVVGIPSKKGVGTGASGANAGIPTVTKLTRIIVGSGPDATCATLGEAIRQAAENCTITVVGPDPFTESVAVSGAALNGLTLKAEPRTILRNSSGGASILSIKDVSGVTVEGFDFDLVGVDCHGVFVSGTAEDVTLKDCTFTQASDKSRWSLLGISSDVKESTGAIRVQRCRFDSRGGAMCVSVDALGDTTASLICEGCQFSSPHTQVYAAQSCRRLRLADNVFVGGTNAINLDIKSWSPDSRFEIVNNTFLGTKHWLGLIGSFRGTAPTGPTDSRVCNNLILGGERIQAGPDQLTIALNTWTFSSNWWERDETTIVDADWGGRLAKSQSRLNDIPFRDVGHAEFLVPAAGSPLLTSGAGGDLPARIGAKGRAASPSVGESPAAPVGPKLTAITVGSGPGATCATLKEAIRRAAGNCTITVIGPGPFEESITVQDAALNGLTLKASPRATWRCPVGEGNETHALLLKDVSRVVIEGFDFEVSSNLGRAVSFTGSVGDVSLTDCGFRHMLPSHKLSLVNQGAGAEALGSRVVIQKCRFAGAEGSCYCLAIDSKMQTGPQVVCEDCYFESTHRHLLVAKSCPQFKLSGSVFVGGHTGLWLDFKPWTGDEHFEIVNNTFVGTRYWFSWADSTPDPAARSGRGGSRLGNNLILGGERTMGKPEQWDAMLAAWTCQSNWWERDATTTVTADRGGKFVTLHDKLNVPVRTGTSDPLFLVPAADSPLLTQGAGGDLPVYIGAKGRPNSQ